jgi:hypothetical protein
MTCDIAHFSGIPHTNGQLWLHAVNTAYNEFQIIWYGVVTSWFAIATAIVIWPNYVPRIRGMRFGTGTQICQFFGMKATDQAC